jgi:hypothetical protein
MHQSSLDARNIEARRKITAAAAELGRALGVPSLETPSAVEQRQPAVAQMRELEHIAALLEAIVGELTHDRQETAHAR